MAANLQLVISAVDKASATLDHVDKKAGGLTGTLKKVGMVGGVAAAAGLGIAGAAAIKFIGVASDLNEVTNKANVVFGQSAKTIQDFGATSAKSLGIAKAEALGYASTLGTILKGSGLTEQASADMSVKLTTLAADMASFNNIPIDQALEKIRAGLVGESEPLRTVGVLLSEAAVKAKAYAMGLAATGAELTDAQKVQARYQLILEQTKDTQGDFARTSDSLANRTRILGAQWKNIQAIIGNALLPVVTELAVTFSDFLARHEQDIQKAVTALSAWAESDALPMIGRAFAQLQQTIDGLTPTVEKVISFFKENEAALIPLIAALVVLAVVFGGPVTAIMALVAAGTLLLANWDTIRAKVEEIWADFNEKFPAMAQIVELAFEFIRLRVQFYIDLVTNIIKIATALWHGDFGAAWEGIKSLFSDALGNILAQFKVILQGILIVAKEIMPLVKTAITAAIQEALDFIKSLPGAFEDAGKAIARGLLRGFKSIAKEIVNIDLNPTGINVPGVDVFGFQHGTPRVPRNMLAFLHAGEMVIPARPAERIRRGEAPAAFPPAVTAGGSSPFDYDRLAGTIASALMGFGIDMDGERIGQLIERRLGARANLYGRAG